MPRLSVVVPFYNVADYIADCLDSLARQTFNDLDIILVDDGSRDASRDIAREFCRHDSRFRIITQENQGLGPARNTGVTHADSEYITFVDSDDLIPAYAYELMIRSLDETGSSFAAGGARRFNNASGVRQSYVHRVPFAEDRPATHVLEYPELALDRMVWNKVYRRTFWDQFNYQFPPIRYEDYPVTIKAHIDAITVDCLTGPVYYWRERESGESITQNKFEYTNLYDRVISAEMVMDIVDKQAPTLRRIVHTHLAHVDLTALVQAFASAPEDRRADLVELGRRLTNRLDNSVLARTPRFDRLQFRALHLGDVELLSRLAQFQLDGGIRGGTRARKHPVVRWWYENEFPGLTDRNRIVPRKLYRLPTWDFKLNTTVTWVEWTDEALIIRGTTEIRHLPTAADSALRMTLIHDGTRTPVKLERFETLDSHGESSPVGFVATVPRAVLAKLSTDGNSGKLDIAMRNSGIQRRMYLHGAQEGNPLMAPGAWVSEKMWIQPGPRDTAAFELTPYGRPWELVKLEVVDDSLVVQVRLPNHRPAPELVLTRPSSNDITVVLEPLSDGTDDQFVASIPIDDLMDPASPDDPFTLSTVRLMQVTSGEETVPLLATGLRRFVGHVHRNRLLTVTRSKDNYAELLEGPVRLVADELTTDDGDHGLRMSVYGDLHAKKVGRLVWRRFVDVSDAHIDVECAVTVSDHRWSAAIDVADLMSLDSLDTHEPHDSLASLAVWSLYAIPAAGSTHAVRIDPYLLGRLPIDIRTEKGRLTVAPRAGTFHVEVR